MESYQLNTESLKFCPIGKALEELGDRWVLYILRASIFGLSRFKDIQNHLGVSKSVLSSKLNWMQEKGLLEKHPYKEANKRTRYEYQLTAKGKALLKVVAALMEWGNEQIKLPGEPTIIPIDKHSKEPLRLVFADQSGRISKGYDVKIKPTYWKPH